MAEKSSSDNVPTEVGTDEKAVSKHQDMRRASTAVSTNTAAVNVIENPLKVSYPSPRFMASPRCQRQTKKNMEIRWNQNTLFPFLPRAQ